jgi:hypothetical protein
MKGSAVAPQSWPFPAASAIRTPRAADAMITCPTTHDIGASPDEIARFFEDDHVHLALIVAPTGVLVTTITRADLSAGQAGSGTAITAYGTLAGRTVSPADDLDRVTARLTQTGQRRAAVIDAAGRLLGLLCLKRTGVGYCSDVDIRQRREATAIGG